MPDTSPSPVTPGAGTEMERNRPQRKACDLCYRKRIKCDSQKPRCAHCVVYDCACTYVSASRRAASRKKEPAKGEAALQARVETLETQLRLLSEKLDKLATAAAAPSAQAQQLSSLVAEAEGARPPPRAGSWHQAAGDLPLLQDVLPVVEDYLATSNAVLPLFHPATLLDMVKKWYWSPEARDATTWAAINVVLALAHRYNDVDAPHPARRTAEHVANTQSVLTEVIMGDAGLLSVQVLVGLVMLFQGSQDLGPATILVAAAIRLAHRLGLHTRRSSAHLDRRVALQRSRVFWIAYILDRDISLRVRQAPVQHEADIDQDLPADEPGDAPTGGVFVAHGGGGSTVNFFRARVELARIEGRVYDGLFSVQAQNSSAEERTQNMADIGRMLDAWMASIPPVFHPGSLSEAGPLGLSRPFCVLYAARLTCLCLINRAHPWNPLWVEGIQDYGRCAAAGEESTVQLPPGWQTLVDESRDFLRLFVSVPRRDASFIWMTLCPCTAGLMCLTANIISNPHLRTVESDMALADATLQFVDRLARQTNSGMLVMLRDISLGLIVNARNIAGQREEPCAPPASTLFLTDEMLSSVPSESRSEQAFDDTPPVAGDLHWAWDLTGV